MAVNYQDPRFQQVENEKATALREVNSTYNNMINSTDKMYQDQVKATELYGQQQQQLQQEQTDFALEQIEQNKEWAEQDYLKEQKASYVDYQKASNSYGANAEAMASRGLTGTGYAESSQVNMFNAYQNRVAVARESFNKAIVEYGNQIKEAQLQNKSELAQIAFETLQKKLELNLAGFQYKNTLLQQQLQAKQQTDDRYYSRWQNVLGQINTENALAEQQRQFNEQMALQREELAFSKAQAQRQSVAQAGGGSSGGSSGGSGGNSASVDKSSGGTNSKKVSSLKKELSRLYDSMYKSSSRLGDKTADAIAKKSQKDALAGALSQGQITEGEFLQIAEDLGF